MTSARRSRLVALFGAATAAAVLLGVAAAWPQVRANAIQIEAARAVLEQRLPAVWARAPVHDRDERLIMAEALAAGGAVAAAQAQYRAYLAAGGEVQRAMLRLEQLAAVGRWCTLRPQEALALAGMLAEPPRPALLLAAACQANGEYDAAIEGLRMAYAAGERTPVALALADALFAQTQAGQLPGDTLGAHYGEIAEVLSGLPRAELDGKALYQLGWSQWQLSEFDAAIANYELCTTKRAEPRYALNCALNLGYGYSAWLPEARRDLTAARRYFSLAQTLVYDEASRREVETARGSLPN
jgi:tetratricopeptide (TPR) repeat protein